MNQKKSTVNNVIWSSVEKIGQVSVQLIISIVLARILSPQDYGLMGILTIFIIIANVIVDAGFSQGLIRKLDCSEKDYSTVFWVNLIFGIFIYGILYSSAPFISNYFKMPQLSILSKVLFLVIPINAFSIIQTTILNKNLNFKIIAKYTILASSISGVIGIAIAYYGGGVWALVYQTLVYSLLFNFFLCIKTKWSPSFIFHTQSIKEIFPFSSKLFASSLLNAIFNNVYTFIIAKLYSQVQLGYYTQANKLALQPANIVDSILNRVSYPTLSKLQDNKDLLRTAYIKFFVLTCAAMIPFMLLLFAISNELILLLLSDKWISIVPYFQAMCIIGITFPLQPLCISVLKVFGESGIIFKLEIIKKIIIVVLVYITFRDGVLSLIYGQIVFFYFALILNMYYSGKLINISIRFLVEKTIPYLLIGLVSLAICLFLSEIIHKTCILLAAKVITYSIIYIALILVFKLEYSSTVIKTFLKK